MPGDKLCHTIRAPAWSRQDFIARVCVCKRIKINRQRRRGGKRCTRNGRRNRRSKVWVAAVCSPPSQGRPSQSSVSCLFQQTGADEKSESPPFHRFSVTRMLPQTVCMQIGGTHTSNGKTDQLSAISSRHHRHIQCELVLPQSATQRRL